MIYLKTFEMFDSPDLKSTLKKGEIKYFKKDIDQMDSSYFKNNKIRRMSDDWYNYDSENTYIDSKIDTQQILHYDLLKRIPLLKYFTYNFKRSASTQILEYEYKKEGLYFDFEITFKIFKYDNNTYSIHFFPHIADVEDSSTDIFKIKHDDYNPDDGHIRIKEYHNFIKNMHIIAKCENDSVFNEMIMKINKNLSIIDTYTEEIMGINLF